MTNFELHRLRREGFSMVISARVFTSFALSTLTFLILSFFLYHQVPPSKEPHADIDSKAYIQRGGLFYTTNRFVTDSSPEQPYYALGYALFIGIAYKLFGQLLAIIIWLQVVLSLLSCFLMMRIAERFFGSQTAKITAGLFAINIGYLTFTQFILTEILLSFFLVLFFERLTAFVDQIKPYSYPSRQCFALPQDERVSTCARGEEPVRASRTIRAYNGCMSLIQAGLALGASIIVKPAAILFVFVVCALLILLLKGNMLHRLGRAAIFAFCFYIPVFGYMTYNHYAFGNFCVSTLDRVNLYYWFFPNVLAAENHTTSDIERTKLLALSQGSHNFDAVGDLFWQKLKDKPLLFVYVWLNNVFKTFLGLYTTNLKVLVEPHVYGGTISFFKMQGGVLGKSWAYITAGATKKWVIAVGIFEAFWSVVRYVLFLLALVVLFRTGKMHWLLLSLAFIGYFSLITGHDGCARFRMMFEFLLIILAAGGVTCLAWKKG